VTRRLDERVVLGAQEGNEVIGQEGLELIPHLTDVVVGDPGMAQPADVVGEPLGEPGVITNSQMTQENGGHQHCAAALSQHAAVMATRAYPMVWRVLPKPERAAIGPLTEDLRCAERAMRHLNRLLGGAAGEDPDNRGRLWSDVEQAWQRHLVDEEPLIERVAPVLDPSRVLSLITLLRRPVGHSLTRPHPMLLHGGWPTGLAIRAQYRIDECRDVLDNRVSWRTGR